MYRHILYTYHCHIFIGRPEMESRGLTAVKKAQPKGFFLPPLFSFYISTTVAGLGLLLFDVCAILIPKTLF